MSRIRSTLTSIFTVRPDEVRPLGWLIALSFFRGLAAVFFDAPANTLFISEFGAERLPYVYLCAAGSSLLLGFAYSKLGASFSPTYVLRATLGVILLSILFFYTSLLLTRSHWVIMGLMIWKEAIFMLSNIVMWAAAGYLFNIRQGKRLFGLVASGGILASIIGGGLVAWIAKIAGVPLLILISAFAMGGMFWTLYHLTASYRTQFLLISDSPDTVQQKHSILDLFRNRYLGLFFSLSILSNFGFFFVDYVYFNRVETAYPDQKTLAAFFGIFASVVGSVQLITSTFLAGPLITRFGLGCGLMALPALNVVGMGIAAVISMTAGLGRSFFWLILLTKLCDEALRSSLLAPSFRILYQPLPPQDRLRFQAVTESIIEPIGVGLAGGVLLLFTHAYPVALHTLCLLLVGILITWLAVGERLRKEYTQLLTQALSKRRLNEVALTLEDGSTVQIFEEGLESVNPAEVIYCLNMLEEVRHPQLLQFLRARINHPANEVRESVLSKLETHGSEKEIPLLREQLKHEPSPRTRGLILQVLCALAEAEALEMAAPYLEDPSPEVRSGAMAGLMRHGGIDGVLVAGTRLQAMVASARVEDRLFSARTLGEIQVRSFYRPLLRLLKDPEVSVQQAALRAAGRLNNPRLIPHLVESIKAPSLRSIAMESLVQAGASAIPFLHETFQQPEQSVDSQRRLLKLVGKIGGDAAIAMLLECSEHPDKTLRREALISLSLCHYKAANSDLKKLRAKIREEAMEATSILAAWSDLGEAPHYVTLRNALESEFRKHQDRVLLLLSFLYDAKPLLYARKELESHSTPQRAHALEVVDNLVGKELKPWVLPLLEEATLSERLEHFAKEFPQKHFSPEERLRMLIDSPISEISLWTRACALYVAGQTKRRDCLPPIQSWIKNHEPILQETALWASERI